MPRYYKRKTEGYQFENLKRAVEDVKNKVLSISKASSTYSVPKSTIHDHLKEEIVTQPKRGHKCVFTEAQEKRLEEHILTCHQLYNVLTANVVRKIAFKFAKAYKVRNNFDRISKMAGRDWYYGFTKRHPNVIVLPTRKLESTAAVRATTAFNEAEVLQFFENQMAKEIIHHVDNTERLTNDVNKSSMNKWKRKVDKGQAVGIKSSTHRRNTVGGGDEEITDGNTMKMNLKGMAQELYKNEKNNSALRELRMQLLRQRSRNSYKPDSRFRNVESEPEVTLYAETVETSDPLEALAVPGPSRNLYPKYDHTVEEKEVKDTSESVQEILPSKIARKDPRLQLSTSSLDFDIKEENTVNDSTRTPEETLADFSIVSQDEVPQGDISSDDIMLPRFLSKAVDSNSDSSVYFKARSILKPKQKVTTEVLFHRYKLKSKREIDRLHNKIRELKASVERYKRQVHKLKRQGYNVTGEK